MLRFVRRLSTSAGRMASTPLVKLSSGHEMPQVGFGIWKVPRSQTAQAVYEAIQLGYRHIDGAYDYSNSAEAGAGVRRALADGLVRRSELFITSKLWNNYHRREHAVAMARAEVEAWGLDYLDLYLVHFPISMRYIAPDELRWPGFWSDADQTRVTELDRVPLSETWGALESLVRTADNPAGVLRSIGVANFSAQLLYDLLSYAAVPPAVLQIEHHPYLAQPGLVAMAHESGMAVTAYSPFGPQSFLELDSPRAKSVQSLLAHPVITGIAERHGRTPAQVLLRWSTQRGIIVIPKSNHVERRQQNLDCCSFDLAADEIDAISALDRGLRFNDPGTLARPIRIFG